ncbi:MULTISPECIES: hypothetical protein [unclassified Caballeronia]|uniref:hypothetical protein n=1 Tax=unclassified Caballeronia TaxID=2646786 RepID=UPI002854949B|nr:MULTISPECIES: hypothetical protein [unclassified Caballeronia]MDR5777682.1 hypothetical protein [Caballeronia sp. LZ002]MDR5853120.1 hypothetical protein [Caballeronia sp. LZ003]
MSAADKTTIVKLLEEGKASDLVDLILGDSPYRVTGETEFESNDERDAYVMTIEHLRFVSKYGAQAGPIKENGRVYFAYPDYFEKWFQLGTPGLAQEDVLNYVNKLT